MVNSPSVPGFGQRLFGGAIVASGLVLFLWPNNYDWLQMRGLPAQGGHIFAAIAATLQIAGGIGMQFRRSSKLGALAVSSVFLVIAFLCVPRIVAGPKVYDHWGNFFEQFSILTGAAIIYAQRSKVWSLMSVGRIGRVCLGLSAASFAIEQAVYLANTATLVPKWIPPSQTFWAIATTIALGLAAVALFPDRTALLAARSLTVVLVSFGLVVWLPLLSSTPRSQTNWSESAETFAIAGAAWILADLIRSSERNQILAEGLVGETQ